MEKRLQLVVFDLDEQRYAIRLAAVRRVVRAAEVTPLPGAPAIVTGVVALAGEVIPVVSLRRRLGFVERETDPADQWIIARTAVRAVGIEVDSVREVIEIAAEEVCPPENVLPGLDRLEGIVTLTDGMILIHDLETFLSLEEERVLTASLAALRQERA